jgi:hypothetical protein
MSIPKGKPRISRKVLLEQEQFTPKHEAYLRREVRKGLDQLDAGHLASFDARKIISEERQKLVRPVRPER